MGTSSVPILVDPVAVHLWRGVGGSWRCQVGELMDGPFFDRRCRKAIESWSGGLSRSIEAGNDHLVRRTREARRDGFGLSASKLGHAGARHAFRDEPSVGVALSMPDQ